MRALVAYVVTLVVFCALDFAWLGWIAMGFYARGLGALLLARPNIAAAAAFYLLYVLGVQIFAVHPALAAGSWTRTWVAGAMFGFFAYATYELTNLATLKGWSLPVTLVDIAWGSVLTALAATAGFAAAARLGGP